MLCCAHQIIKVQEDPSNIPEGETPRSLLMYAFDTNVDACKPGDKVTVTGEEEQACTRFSNFFVVLAVQRPDAGKREPAVPCAALSCRQCSRSHQPRCDTSLLLASCAGVFRATRMRLNPRQRAAHALFKTYIDIVHVDKEEGDKLFKQRTGGQVGPCPAATTSRMRLG
jgi:hypothetical protein